MKKPTFVVYVVFKILFMFLDSFDYQTTILMTPVIEQQYNISKKTATWFQMSMSNVQAFLSVPMIALTQHLNSKITILIVLTVLSGLYISTNFIVNLPLIFVVKYGQSLMLSFVYLQINIYLQTHFDFDIRQFYTNINEIVITSVNIVSPLILAIFIDRVTWQQMYFISAAQCVILGLFVLIFVQFDKVDEIKNQEKEKCSISYFLPIMLIFVIGCVFAQFSFKILTYITIFALMQLLRCLTKTLIPIQFCQTMVHSINQFVIPHIIPRKKLNYINSGRQLFSLSSALLQFTIQDKVKLYIHVVCCCSCLLIYQVLKLCACQYQTITFLLIIYGLETFFSAMINHYVQKEVFVQKNQQHQIISTSVQIRQLGGSFGTMIGGFHKSNNDTEWICIIVLSYAFEMAYVLLFNSEEKQEQQQMEQEII